MSVRAQECYEDALAREGYTALIFLREVDDGGGSFASCAGLNHEPPLIPASDESLLGSVDLVSDLLPLPSPSHPAVRNECRVLLQHRGAELKALATGMKKPHAKVFSRAGERLCACLVTSTRGLGAGAGSSRHPGVLSTARRPL